MITIVDFTGEKPKTLEEATAKAMNELSEKLESGLSEEEKELYSQLSDEDRQKYRDMCLTVVGIVEDDKVTRYRNTFDEDVIDVFAKREE